MLRVYGRTPDEIVSEIIEEEFPLARTGSPSTCLIGFMAEYWFNDYYYRVKDGKYEEELGVTYTQLRGIEIGFEGWLPEEQLADFGEHWTERWDQEEIEEGIEFGARVWNHYQNVKAAQG